MSLSVLSFPSVISTFCTVLLIGIVIFDGLWKTKAPGSILDPMPTHLGPELDHANWLGGIGLVLAGFGGHAVIPSIARDMKHPESADRVFNIAYTVAGAVAFIAGATGYLMFGDTVSDEITRDLMLPLYNYPSILNLCAVWMIVVNPLTKFGLCSRPLNIAVEGFLGLAPNPGVHPPRDRRRSIVEQVSSTISTRLSAAGASDYLSHDDDVFDERPKSPVTPLYDPTATRRMEGTKGVLRILSRTIITVACTATAILLPGFEKVMAFLGSFSSFLICIILPVSGLELLAMRTPQLTPDRLLPPPQPAAAQPRPERLACARQPRRPDGHDRREHDHDVHGHDLGIPPWFGAAAVSRHSPACRLLGRRLAGRLCVSSQRIVRTSAVSGIGQRPDLDLDMPSLSLS